jgi:hypothetical protein
MVVTGTTWSWANQQRFDRVHLLGGSEEKLVFWDILKV